MVGILSNLQIIAKFEGQYENINPKKGYKYTLWQKIHMMRPILPS